MEIVSRSFKTIEEIEAPEILYKYRNFANENHFKILTDNEIFFSPPTSFEDKVDCKIPIRYDLLSNQEIFEKYLSDSKERNNGYTRQQHRNWARDWTKKSPLKNKARLEKYTEQEFQDYDKRIGILSLTGNNSSLEMWNKYSDNRTGFCVGFHTKQLFQFLGGGGPVVYLDELPTIRPRPWHSFDQQRYLRVFSKLRKWEFEEEYRTLIFNINELTTDQRKRQLPNEVYKEIIMGQEISKENMDRIEEIIATRHKSIELKKQTLDENKIKIV